MGEVWVKVGEIGVLGIELHRYEVKRNEFKDWSIQRSTFGQKYWLNLNTLEESHEHPGEAYFRVNLKNIRKKSEAQFRQNVLQSIDQNFRCFMLMKRHSFIKYFSS